ncbi:Tyrosinase central domain protein [Lasiodiplodia theobromae]|uniref:Tyrosinase-like protein orsC n=1 Tax=Lasiodiplodia theobromae TaxID=45133 RepID=A0A5N5DP00_9PEZI|nr:Tyrosinase central domain protein [Lasiodiplodia theobromae]KAB2579340.1 Tyrosinase-like protein orsC [Lasiodiplodia theobromae]KAF4542091.1 Tyrosinase central domain protein [Lasiodiplodia theobromae]
MRLEDLVAATALLGVASGAVIEKKEAATSLKTDQLAAQAMGNLAQFVQVNGYFSDGCTLENISFRREWGALSAEERKEYIAAVQCISTKPSRTPKELCPGCVTRYDDFVATHINQTLTIHGTGNFLSWHRYFTWSYEQALRNECGYTGTQPYWNWPQYAEDPLSSPIFDGSDTSMSGNGVYRNHTPVYVPSSALPYVEIPPAQGGGCVYTGPFRNFTTRLGPVSPAYEGLPTNPSADGLGSNPRCLRRDINPWVSSRFTNDLNTSSLIETYSDVSDFQTIMQGDFPSGYLGVHTGGHLTINGDPGGDLFASPGDPVFFLHHAMIDRVWWTWQNQDVAARTYAVGGTHTLNNSPPSANTTLDDILDLAYTADPITIRDAMSTLAGPFCYVYV